jgi:tetratricopeptide (TPR) repeat protein
MIQELSHYIGKKVRITPKFGAVREVVLAYIDVPENIIWFEDGSSMMISIVKEVSNGTEKQTINLPKQTNLNEEEKKNNNIFDVEKAATEQIEEIKAKYEGTELNILFEFINPKLQEQLPDEIKNFDSTGRSSDEAKLWAQFMAHFNEYKKAVKSKDKSASEIQLENITNKLKILTESPNLTESNYFKRLLGFFYLKKGEYDNSVLQHSLIVKSDNNNLDIWKNLAILAQKQNNNELLCLCLENLFKGKSNLGDDMWFFYINLVITLSNYTALTSLLISQNSTAKEKQNIFEAAVYCLLKSNAIEKAKGILIKVISERSNIYSAALELLQNLPQKSAQSYVLFKLEWNKRTTLTNVTKPLVTSSTNFQKTKTNHNLPTHTQSYVSKGLNAASLKNARIERDVTKNFAKAEILFVKGIENETDATYRERAVRDLASMYAQQMNMPQKAIEVIQKYQNTLSDADLNLLYTFNFQLGEYEEAIKIQKNILETTTRKDMRLSKYFNIAACFLKLNNFKEAESYYGKALQINPSQYTIERNIALCIFKQGKTEEAKKILNRIIADYGDANSQKLLDTIDGKNQNELLTDTNGLGNENLDDFTNFYLLNCDLQYVADRVKNSKYAGSIDDLKQDLKKLNEIADNAKGARNAEVRSQVFLNIAKILYDLEGGGNEFYKILCRSLTSKADDTVQKGFEIDTVKTYYLAALKSYNSLIFDENYKTDSSDAIIALSRYLYAHLGKDKIPFSDLTIEKSISEVLEQNINKNKIYFALAILFARSPEYSMRRVLKIVFENAVFKNSSCSFLNIPANSSYEELADAWKKQAKEIIKKENELSAQLSPLRNFKITEIWLLVGFERIKNSINKVLFDLDKEYLADLQNLLDYCISLCKSSDFDDKNNKIEDIKFRAENLLKKIQKNPTKLAIEEVYPILNNLLNALEKFVSFLFANSKPELLFSSVFTAYQLKNGNQIDLQIKIENKSEGHAEEVELRLEANPTYFKSNADIVVFYRTIKGKKSDSKIIELELTEKAIQEKAFSIKVDAAFKNRLNERFTTPSESLAVQLGAQKDFVRMEPNPYVNGASGKAVTSEEMFYGRQEYIEAAYKTMVNDGISYVIYGQFRSGKSSILTHLEKKLESNPQIIVVKLGDIGKFMGESSTPIFYRFLHQILRALRDEVRKKTVTTGLSSIDFSIPDSRLFYEHPVPVDYFYEIMDSFQNQKNNLADWENIRIIVSMDEFTYIYEKIVKGDLSTDFMKNWKALLAKNYFNVVLVAQDVFPKFFAQYENAFGTIFSKRITYLDVQNARELIDEPIKKLNNGESKFRENAVDKIIELTAGHPWYIQIFCNALFDYINDDRQQYITGANIDKVKEKLLRGKDRKDQFKNFIENGDPSDDKISEKDTTFVLKKIAENTKNYDDGYCQKSTINCTTEADLNVILKDLESREVIETHIEKGYKIRVGLFKEWLNENPNVWE